MASALGLKYNCVNMKNGCKEVLTETALEDHEPECIYRLVPCLEKQIWKTSKCDAKVTFQDVIQHFEEQHKKMKQLHSKVKVTGSCANELGLSGRNCKWDPMKLDLNNQIFLWNMKTVDKVVYYWVYILGSPNEAKHFSYTLKLFGPKNTITFEGGQVAAIDESFDTLSEAGKCFAIPHKNFVAQVLNEDRKYEYSLQIRNLKEEVKDDNYESGISDNDEESKE